MRLKTLLKIVFPVLLLSLSVTSCKKLLETTPGNVLEEKNMYRDIFDADAAINGLYGKFMNLAEDYVVLNELRADLTTTTANSNENLKQLNEHTAQNTNPYTSVKPFYEVILNCNDILYNLDIMLQDKKLKVADYNMRYSDVTALRSWVYLQLGIHFGNVPYITAPLSNAADIENLSAATRIPLNSLIDTLTKAMQNLPYIVPYAPTAGLVTIVDGYNTGKFFINKQMLLGELYLWKGDYRNAAMSLKSVMETGTGDLFDYRISYSSKGDNNDIAVGYVRYREEDESMLIDNNSQGWRSIFARGQDALFNYEWIWFLPFDKNFAPNNPFVNLFSNRGGSYLLKPSQAAMDNWNSQVQKNDFPYDARGSKFSYKILDGQPVIMKYLYNYLSGPNFTPANVFDKSGKWFLYRAAALHLAFAEAANRDNHSALAYTLVNQGLSVTNKVTPDPFPYNFDSRKSDNPRIVGDWSTNAGIRGRANLYSKPIVGDSVLGVEDQIINEAGLELAYEGRRWSDLLRVAIRRNDPSFIADKIYNKLKKENNPLADAARAKLMNKDWFLPFK